MRSTTLLILSASVTLSALMLPGLSANAGTITRRERNQQIRIHQGVKSGELTRGEARRLEQQQIGIERQRRRAWSDGTLTGKERARLHVNQDRASGRIYRTKHNDRSR